MNGYTIFIQPAGGSAEDMHRVDAPLVTEAKAFAKWLHSATGAAVRIYDLRTLKVHSTVGEFREDWV